MRKIILASASPRRRELLAAAGVIFQICAAEGEEKITADSPDEIVCELSAQKAEEIASKFELEDGTVIIGADTIVSYKSEILGLQWRKQREAKPRGGANPKNNVSVRTAVCNSTARSWNR